MNKNIDLPNEILKVLANHPQPSNLMSFYSLKEKLQIEPESKEKLIISLERIAKTKFGRPI